MCDGVNLRKAPIGLSSMRSDRRHGVRPLSLCSVMSPLTSGSPYITLRACSHRYCAALRQKAKWAQIQIEGEERWSRKFSPCRFKELKIGLLAFLSCEEKRSKVTPAKPLCQFFCNGWTAAFGGQGSPPHWMFNSLPLPSNSQNMAAWTSVDHPSLDQRLPYIQPPSLLEGPRREKAAILPFVAIQEQRGGGEGWDKKQKDKKKDRRRKEENELPGLKYWDC